MRCELTINSPLLTESDTIQLNRGEREIQFSKMEAHHFLPPEVILVLIELGRDISYSAAYDTVKYALGKLMGVLCKKKAHEKTQTRMEIVCRDQKYSVSFNFELTEEQKNQLVEIATKKLLEKD